MVGTRRKRESKGKIGRGRLLILPCLLRLSFDGPVHVRIWRCSACGLVEVDGPCLDVSVIGRFISLFFSPERTSYVSFLYLMNEYYSVPVNRIYSLYVYVLFLVVDLGKEWELKI